MFQRFGRGLTRTLSGGNDAVPAWVSDLEQDTDAGFFAPGDPVWEVHSSVTTIVAGVRALLMQALHPGALAGVWDHSRFREDPLGRLEGTIRWIFSVTFGDTTTARHACNWVSRLHESVRGEYLDGQGVQRPYKASDQELLRWVHIAFTDAFLSANQRYDKPVDANEYVSGWKLAGTLMGVNNPPTTESEMRQELHDWLKNGDLRRDERTEEVVKFIKNPPLPGAQRWGYKIIFRAAVDSLEPEFRKMLQLKPSRTPQVMRGVVRLTLKVVEKGLGSRPRPAELASLRRRARLGE